MKEIQRKMRQAVVWVIFVVCMALPAQFAPPWANEAMAGLLSNDALVLDERPAEVGAAESPAPVSQTQPDAQTAQKLVAARTKIHETLGKVVLAMATTPRYRHLPIGDITSLILDPLINDRIAIATSAKSGGKPETGDTAGIAIWASVSAEVDAKIREQIEAGVFPVRLAQNDWASGTIKWLLDVIAPNAQLATAVIANFRQVTKGGELHVHPLVSRQIDPGTLNAFKTGSPPQAEG